MNANQYMLTPKTKFLITFKIKCRVCGKIEELYFGEGDLEMKENFLKWVTEHKTFPFERHCDCDPDSIMIHDLVSYKIKKDGN